MRERIIHGLVVCAIVVIVLAGLWILAGLGHGG